MYKINRTDQVDVDLYDLRINHTGFILFDRESVKADVDYYEKHAETCYDLARMRMVYKSGNRYSQMSRDTIIDYLIEFEGCPESFFKTGKTKSYSLDSKRVLAVLYEKGFAREFIENYIEYKSWSTKCSKLTTILKTCRDLGGVSKTGRELYKLPFNANVQTNRRFNYSDFDIISQIPKSMANCISVEDGYFLAWGDFAQSDLRIAYNLFLRTPENDKLFSQYDDKYEAVARMVANLNHEQFNYDQFKEERDVYKRNTLATIYGKRSAAIAEDAAFIRRFSEFVEKHEGYKLFKQRLDEYMQIDLPIMVSSYFGFVQQVYAGPGASKSSIMDVALNTPVQTGSSEIVIDVVNHILDTCYSMGYTEDDICLYMTRHDEPIFKIKESAKDVLKVLLDSSTVIVDDWTPLQMDWNVGYSYKIPDEALEADLQHVRDTYTETIVKPEAVCDTFYEPLDKVFTLSVATQKTPDCKTIVTFYDDKQNEVMYSLFETLDDEQIVTECKCKIRDATKKIHDAGYKHILVFSTFINGADFYEDCAITYKIINTNEALFSAKRLTELMAWRYCKKAGLEPCVAHPIFTSFDDWINEVKDSSLLIQK